jgi:hypothetical protein
LAIEKASSGKYVCRWNYGWHSVRSLSDTGRRLHSPSPRPCRPQSSPQDRSRLRREIWCLRLGSSTQRVWPEHLD